ncbi:MAG: hypothetical protein E7616_04545 [Ruminococcaceae bacterium]|nr:hypothetical protein [Oscillospiraceae bacterium]
MKKLLCIIFSCVLLLSFTSCAFIDRLQGDMRQLDYDKEGNLLYSENAYYRVDDRFEVITGKNDRVVELGWQSQFPFFPDMHYYAFDEENPLFIFCDNGKSTVYNKGLYVRSDYDLYSEIYTVDNTDIEFSLSAAMTKSDVEVSKIDHEASMYLKMFLKDDPRIQIELAGPYQYNGNWYFIHTGETWIISDEFVAMLIEAYILKK